MKILKRLLLVFIWDILAAICIVTAIMITSPVLAIIGVFLYVFPMILDLAINDKYIVRHGEDYYEWKIRNKKK